MRSKPYLVEPAIVNQAAVEVATLAQRMTSQYFSHVAAMYVARDRRAEMFAPAIEPGQSVPILRLPRRDGNDMVMWFNHYLAKNMKPETRQDFDAVSIRFTRTSSGSVDFWSEVQRVYEKRICTSLPSSLRIAWNGVLKPRHFLGVRLAVRTMSWISSSDTLSMSI